MLKVFTFLLLAQLAACGSNSSTSEVKSAGDASDKNDAIHSILDSNNASVAALESYVRFLSEKNTPRDHSQVATLDKIAGYIRTEFESFGYSAEEQTFEVNGKTYRNVSVRVGPTGGKRVIVGAHYDAAGALPGADDNASGVAGLLELGRLLKAEKNLKVQIELVAYSLEEPPYFATNEMGSAVHAEKLTPSDVQLMISLEMIGYFSDEPKSQEYPSIPNVPESVLIGTYGDVGNYISLIGRSAEKPFLARFETVMNKTSNLKTISLAVPAAVKGVAWSDHRNYWDHNIAAFMVTDTAMFRNKAYHTANDTWDRLDFSRMGQVVDGLRAGLVSLGVNPL